MGVVSLFLSQFLLHLYNATTMEVKILHYILFYLPIIAIKTIKSAMETIATTIIIVLVISVESVALVEFMVLVGSVVSVELVLSDTIVVASVRFVLIVGSIKQKINC